MTTRINCARSRGDEMCVTRDGHALMLITYAVEGSAAFALSPATATQLRAELTSFIEASYRVS